MKIPISDYFYLGKWGKSALLLWNKLHTSLCCSPTVILFFNFKNTNLEALSAFKHVKLYPSTKDMLIKSEFTKLN